MRNQIIIKKKKNVEYSPSCSFRTCIHIWLCVGMRFEYYFFFSLLLFFSWARVFHIAAVGLQKNIMLAGISDALCMRNVLTVCNARLLGCTCYALCNNEWQVYGIPAMYRGNDSLCLHTDIFDCKLPEMRNTLG